ncbi:MAG: hypothetical protein MZV65_45395 [Chromatiales bacterium]|nr:hypothetical protein [Chromatiales bacterium]
MRAHVDDGVFRYLPGWASIEAIDADLRFSGTDMRIAGRSGRIGALRVGRTTVAIADFKAPDGPLARIDSRWITGPLADSLRVLADSKSPVFTSWLVPGMEATGNGVLALAIDLPLPALKPVIRGQYRLVDNTPVLPYPGLRADRAARDDRFQRDRAARRCGAGRLPGRRYPCRVLADDRR